jgi:hypothetical protein
MSSNLSSVLILFRGETASSGADQKGIDSRSIWKRKVRFIIQIGEIKIAIFKAHLFL